MLNGIELGKISTSDTELAIIKEEASNAIFAVEASYLEQDVGPLISPYANGCVSLDETDRELWVVSGRLWGEDDDTVHCVEVSPGGDPAQVFSDRLMRDAGLDPEEHEEDDDEDTVIVVSCVSLTDFLAGKIG